MTAGAAPAATETALVRPVAGLMKAAVELARERGRPEVATELEAELAPRPGAGVTAVIVGESGRGKSELVNAILGHDVSPAGLENPAPAYILVRHAAKPTARLFTEGSLDGRDVRLDEIRGYMEAGGDHDAVGHVEVGLPYDLLAGGLTLDRRARCPRPWRRPPRGDARGAVPRRRSRLRDGRRCAA